MRSKRRIGARHVRLGHREERPRPPGDERLEEPLLLLRRAELVQDLGVAGVGRLAAEDELRPVGAADLLVHAGVVEKAVAGAAGLRRHVRRPEPRRARLRLQARDERLRRVVLAVEQALVREHVLLHERPVVGPALEVRRREECRAHTQ